MNLGKMVIVSSNSGPRSIRGKLTTDYIVWDGHKLVIVKSGKPAEVECGPQFIGGGLGIVYGLQKLAKLSLSDAFSLAEKSMFQAGFKPQFCIDIGDSRDLSLLALPSSLLKSCGFAEHVWKNEADAILKMALIRKWEIQVLGGGSIESCATINLQQKKTFKPEVTSSQFNLDYWAIAPVWQKSGLGPDFVRDAKDWAIDLYSDLISSIRQGAGLSKISISPV